MRLFIYDTWCENPIHFEKNDFFRILINFYRFQTLLKRAHFGGSASDDFLQTPQNIWKYHSIISKLSDLVKEHLSYKVATSTPPIAKIAIFSWLRVLSTQFFFWLTMNVLKCLQTKNEILCDQSSYLKSHIHQNSWCFNFFLSFGFIR